MKQFSIVLSLFVLAIASNSFAGNDNETEAKNFRFTYEYLQEAFRPYAKVRYFVPGFGLYTHCVVVLEHSQPIDLNSKKQGAVLWSNRGRHLETENRKQPSTYYATLGIRPAGNSLDGGFFFIHPERSILDVSLNWKILGFYHSKDEMTEALKSAVKHLFEDGINKTDQDDVKLLDWQDKGDHGLRQYLVNLADFWGTSVGY